MNLVTAQIGHIHQFVHTKLCVVYTYQHLSLAFQTVILEQGERERQSLVKAILGNCYACPYLVALVFFFSQLTCFMVAGESGAQD